MEPGDSGRAGRDHRGEGALHNQRLEYLQGTSGRHLQFSDPAGGRSFFRRPAGGVRGGGVVCVETQDAGAGDLRCVRSWAGARTLDRANWLLRRGMLLREGDTSLVGRGLPQSAGELDYRDAARRAARTDTTIRVGGGAGELLLPDVAAETPKV